MTEQKIFKVNATVDDDINLIADSIQKIEGDRIILVLPEGNDLLNSPVGLKALHRKVIGLHKSVIVVIPMGPYRDVLMQSGFIFSETADIPDAMWSRAETQVADKKITEVGLNSAKSQKTKKTVEDFNTMFKEESVKPEIPQQASGAGMIGMDFSKMTTTKKGGSPFEMISGMFKKEKKEESMTTEVVQNKGDKKKFNPAALRVIGFILGGTLLLFGGLFVVYYMYVPSLRIELKVVSDQISITDTVSATSGITGFDITKKEVQLLKENATQDGSENITATGEGSSGTKATGTMTLINNATTPAAIPAASIVVSPGGLKFVTTTAVTIPASGSNTAVGVVASNFGEEYNLTIVPGFTVEGFATVSGTNNAAFTGGTKKTFVVLSKKDVDDATDQLKKKLFEQLKSDLEFRNKQNGYQFIQESLKSELDGQATVNPAVGSETQEAFLQLKTKGSAYYYHKESFQKLIEKLITESYRQTKGKDSATDLIVDGIKIEVKKITILAGDKVTFDFTASGLVTPRINTDQLEADIAGKKWPEMLTRLTAIDTLASSPNVTFYPTWMPEVLKYVPSEPSRIDISVKVAE